MGLPYEKDMGTYFAKYDARYKTDIDSNSAFTRKMTDCVELARKMVTEATAAVNARWEKENDSLDKMIRFHFTGEYDRNKKDIEEIMEESGMDVIYESTRKGLSGKFRLACVPDNKLQDPTKTDEGGRMIGYVSQKVKSDVKPKHPEWKTEEKGKRDIDPVILRGSIHLQYGLFYTPPKFIPVDANEMNIKGIVHSEVGIAMAIVHEATHRWAFTTDNAGYLGSEKYNNARLQVKGKNADSYAALALSIYVGKLVKTDKDIPGFSEVK